MYSPRPLHSPPPTTLLAPLLPSQRRGPPRPPADCRRPSRAVPRRMPSLVESGPSLSPLCCRCRPPRLPRARPTPIAVAVAVTTTAVAVTVALASAHPDPRLPPSPSPPSSSTLTPSQSLSLPPPPPQCFRCSRPTQIPPSLETLPPPSRYATSPPLVAVELHLFPVAVRRDVDPPSCRVQTDLRFAAPARTQPVPRPCRARMDPPPRRVVPQPSTLAAGLTRRSPLAARSPDVLHRSRQSPPRLSPLPPRSSPVRRQSPSPELVQTTSPSTPPVLLASPRL